MHCAACGASSPGLGSCPQCRTSPAAVWLLAMSLLVWAAALTLDAVDRILLYAPVAKALAGLGSEPPAAARLYFAASTYLRYPALAWAVVVPLAIATRAGQIDAWKWSRRYANSAALAFGWAALGLVLCYAAARSFGPALR